MIPSKSWKRVHSGIFRTARCLLPCFCEQSPGSPTCFYHLKMHTILCFASHRKGCRLQRFLFYALLALCFTANVTLHSFQYWWFLLFHFWPFFFHFVLFLPLEITFVTYSSFSIPKSHQTDRSKISEFPVIINVTPVSLALLSALRGNWPYQKDSFPVDFH